MFMSDKNTDQVENLKNPGGRPSKYKKIEDYLDLVMKLAKHGMIDSQIADILGISYTTLNEYKREHPEFKTALNDGKKISNKKVVRALYERAIGYSHPEDKIFVTKEGATVIVPTTKYYPPDTGACVYWTKNRMPKKWKEKQEIAVTDNTKIIMSDAFMPKPEEEKTEDEPE